jgi:hypothetical protein
MKILKLFEVLVHATIVVMILPGFLAALLVLRTLLHDFGIWALPNHYGYVIPKNIWQLSLHHKMVMSEFGGLSLTQVYFLLIPFASSFIDQILFYKYLKDNIKKRIFAWLLTLCVFAALWPVRNNVLESRLQHEQAQIICNARYKSSKETEFRMSSGICEKHTQSLIRGGVASCMAEFDEKTPEKTKADFCEHLNTLRNSITQATRNP